MKVFYLYCIVVMMNVSCSPISLEEHQEEGKMIVCSLLKELRDVSSKEDLLDKKKILQKKFSSLVNIMISAKKRQMKVPEDQFVKERGRDLSDLLQKELYRIYQIEGCRELMEEIEGESFYRLHRFHQEIVVQRKHFLSCFGQHQNNYCAMN